MLGQISGLRTSQFSNSQALVNKSPQEKRCARAQWNTCSVHKGGGSCMGWLIFCTSWHWNAGFGWRTRVLLCHNHILLHFKLEQQKQRSCFHMINNGNKTWLNNSPPKGEKLLGAFSLLIFWFAVSWLFYFLKRVYSIRENVPWELNYVTFISVNMWWNEHWAVQLTLLHYLHWYIQPY